MNERKHDSTEQGPKLIPTIANCGGHDHQESKWAALVNDNVIPLPGRRVNPSVLKFQAAVPDNDTLIRDHNSPNDFVVADDELVDLAQGNVFYTIATCDAQSRSQCSELPKRAFFINDRAEVTIRAEQTGQTIRELFGLPAHANLVRDNEGGDDQPITPSETVRFEDGPVFYTRSVAATLSITVNSRIFTENDGVKDSMTGQEIAALVYPEKPRETKIWLVSDGNREIGLDEGVKIRGCEVFDVVRKKVDGGFESSRVERELSVLRAGGQIVTEVNNPAAVVYHGLRTKPGCAVSETDVLVLIPSAYPGQMLDGAYLPEGSPLIGRVKGNPQEHRVNALGRTWLQISYHPHNGGGGPQWNPTVHGLHTYLGEVLSWLYDTN